MYELGELHRCRGDLAAAEQSFASACGYGVDALPGLALLRLTKDRATDARAALDTALAEAAEPQDEARLLPALVEVALAQGDAAAAAAAGDRLSGIAERLMLPAHIARSATAQGRLLLAAGDAKGAAAAFRLAARIWRVEVRAPYEAALVQILLGQALRELGEDTDAKLALSSAHTALTRLGARPAAAQATAALATLGGAQHDPSAVTRRTFLFTDIVSSTALLEAIGDQAWQQLVGWHDAALRAEFAEHHGEEVDHAGDGFFVTFDHPGAALEAAVAIQRRLAAHRRDAGFAPSVRIGIHAADALHADGAYRGRGVHVAARVAAAATGGEILISSESLPDGMTNAVTEPRSVKLKGLAQPLDVVSVVWLE